MIYLFTPYRFKTYFTELNFLHSPYTPHIAPSNLSFTTLILFGNMQECRPPWPRGLRRRSAAARMLRLWVRIQPGAWVSVSCECCVLACRGLCDELVTRPEESYRLWCVVVCDLETMTHAGPQRPPPKKNTQ